MASGLLTGVPPAAAKAVLACCILLLLLRELKVVSFPLVENHRQVPQSVLMLPGHLPTFRFGLELGTGVRTYVPAVAPYMVAAAILLLSVPWTVAWVAGAGFALGRAATPVLRLMSVDVAGWDGLLARRLRWLTPCSAGLAACALAVLLLTAG